MRRRDIIALLGSASAAAIWPCAATGQQTGRSGVPLIGFLSSRASDTERPLVAAFLDGLKEQGYIDGQNVALEYRWAEGRYEQLPALAADLVRRRVAVRVTAGGAQPAQAAKAATAIIPIVFTTGDDPVKLGLVASLNQPGGNATGVAVFVTSLLPKRLQLLRELIPTAGLYAGRILRGTKPVELPVVRAVKFELVINLKDRAGVRACRAGHLARQCGRSDRMKRSARSFRAVMGDDLAAGAWPAGSKGLPDEIAQRLNQETIRILALPQTCQRLERDAFDPKSLTPGQLAAFMQSEIARGAPIAQAAGMKR